MKKSLLIACAIIFAGNSFADIFIGSRVSVNSNSGNRAADCSPANERIYTEFNNVRAIIETAGFLWEDRATQSAGYEYPKGSNSFVLFSGALWMGGEDANGQLKIAAHRYRDGNDYWAGPLGYLTNNLDTFDPFEKLSPETPIVRAHGGSAEIPPAECEKWDEFYTIRRVEVLAFIKWWNCYKGISAPEDCIGVVRPNDDIMRRIEEWPAHGNTGLGQDQYLAPFYDNALEGETGNGVYSPLEDGDYPWYDINKDLECGNDRRITLSGDETHWWVFNDRGNIHTETNGDPIGMEVRAQAFSFATDDEINNMIFYNYELINRGTQVLYNTYFGQYVDPDIGLASNDYVGCDVERGLGYCYNGEITDQGQAGQTPYTNPPAVGIDFFEGPYQDNDGLDNPVYKAVADSTEPIALLPEVYANNGIPYKGLGIGYGDGVTDNERFGMQRFVYYNNSTSDVGDPQTSAEYYNYLQGKWRNNESMTYGGDGYGPNSSNIPTKFMFPGDSDPLGWGTYPLTVPFTENWDEVSAGLQPGDRRFIQSSGSFTLRPGAVNNITVGVVIGQSNDTDPQAAVRALKVADTKAQDLFDNCFEVLEPPKAPILTIQELENELILYLSDLAGVDPIEDYEAVDFRIKTPKAVSDSGEVYNNKFTFEGFQVYQMVDELSSISEIGDLSKARLVAQTDIQNGVGKLVNYTYDEELEISIPSVMVEPAGDNGLDEGIRRSFSVKEDLFAISDRGLVNHRKYYYLAVSYAYNEFKPYDPSNAELLDGQKRPYLRSGISVTGESISSVVGIPHDPTPEADGRLFTTYYNYQPEITQLDGEGNGGTFLELTEETVKTILEDGSIDYPTYKSGSGPVDIKVVDPLNVKGGDYRLGFTSDAADFEENIWWLERFSEEGRDTVWSTKAISVVREQLILDWGISVKVNQQYYEKVAGGELYTAPIGATITYADPSKRWFSFVYDDDAIYPSNWIRSGNGNFLEEHGSDDGQPNTTCIPENWIYQECHYDDFEIDNADSHYETLLEGGIAPFRMVGSGAYGSPFGYPGEKLETAWYDNNDSWFILSDNARDNASLEYLHDVDIILTNDSSKWTRSVVIEINDNTTNSEYPVDEILQPRSDKSVDKSGRSADDPNYNVAEGDLVNPYGMGWFPGYAIDVNTGARLNIVFSENSWLPGDNGNDMVWNPTANYADAANVPIFGGMHYVYVFGENVNNNDCPKYDNGEWLRNKLDVDKTDNQRNIDYFKVWRQCFWVMEPMLAEGETRLSTDVKISARIKKPYVEREEPEENDGFPLYGFHLDNPSVVMDGDQLISVIDNINVVPNPYYAYSEYEITKRDNRVKITNLPERCEINIFNMHGALIRRFKKDDPLTSIEWDLRNHESIPIAGGMYIIHVAIDVPDDSGQIITHEKILKWFGSLRVADLDNL